MTIRQKFLQTVYPAYVKLSRLSEKKSRILTNETIVPPVSFYYLQGELPGEKPLDFKTFKGKKVLLVNTASGCGFTEQFDQLQKLYKQYNHALVVLAFPTTDFDTDNNNDEQIALFCKENFRVSFPILKKSVVKKTKSQNNIYKWLTNPVENGWNSQPPIWNFCKYLVNEEGMLTGYFGSAIEPLGSEILKTITPWPPKG
jgi:glutathione peroxidase